jgi:putative Mn2+ efflux pump MntP
MDAVAVSIASGLSVKTLRVHDAFKIAAFFGVFQAVMPLLGYLLGLSIAQWLSVYGSVIAFVVLLGLGLKMIHESSGRRRPESTPRSRTTTSCWCWPSPPVSMRCGRLACILAPANRTPSTSS